MIGKDLPRGTWITIRSLPLEVTEEQIQSWLSSCGIDLPLANIAVAANHHRYAQAIVCLATENVCDLFARATEGQFLGRQVDIQFKGKNEVYFARSGNTVEARR